MILVVAVVSIGVFAAALWLFGVVRTGSGAIEIARAALSVLADNALGDAAREEAIQRASIRLFGAAGSILVRAGLAAALSAVPIVLADWAGAVPYRDSIHFLARWDVISGVTFAMVLGYAVWVTACRFR